MEDGHWSWVVGEPTPEHSGPWRYQWEAQEYADELNGGKSVETADEGKKDE